MRSAPEVLINVAAAHPTIADALISQRPLLVVALEADRAALLQQLADEELAVRREDERYWRPLRFELEQLRRDRRER